MKTCLGLRSEVPTIGLLLTVAWLAGAAAMAASDDAMAAAAATSSSSRDASAAAQACRSAIPGAPSTATSPEQRERWRRRSTDGGSGIEAAAAAGHRSRRGAGPCIADDRRSAASSAAAGTRDDQQDSLQPPMERRAADAASHRGEGAPPGGRHAAAVSDDAERTNVTGSGGVVIHYPGEHDGIHDGNDGGSDGSNDGKPQTGGGGGKEAEPSPTNGTLHATTTELPAATAAAAVSAGDAGTASARDDAGGGSSIGTRASSTAVPTAGVTESPALLSGGTPTHSEHEAAMSVTALQVVSVEAGTSASNGSGHAWSPTTEPAAATTVAVGTATPSHATTVAPKPTKPHVGEVTDPKLPPKVPPVVNGTVVPPLPPPANGTGQAARSTQPAATAEGCSQHPGTDQMVPSGSLQSTMATAISPPSPSPSAAGGTSSTAAKSSAQPTAKAPTPLPYIRLSVSMSRERFCCEADEFRATMMRVMERAGERLSSKTQVQIADVDDEPCPPDSTCPQQPPESAASDGDSSKDDDEMLHPRRWLERRSVSAADGGALPQWQQQQPAMPEGFLPKPLSAADSSLVVLFYLSSHSDTRANATLTKLCYDSLKNEGGKEVIASSRLFNGLIQSVYYEGYTVGAPESPAEQSSNQSMVVVIALAAVAGACLAALALLQMVIMRRRSRGRSMRASSSHSRGLAAEDGQSVQSLPASLAALRRSLRRSFRGSDSSTQRSFAFVNVAMQTEKDAMSNPMSFSKLATRSLEVDYLEEEFKTIPTNLPRMSQMQHGWANKNRFANIIPLEATRVKLQASTEAASDYINANYVSGYRGQTRAYIAAQSPMHNTVDDFWRMVWEQQSQVIVALTGWVEDGQPRCNDYLPDACGIDNVKVYGHFQVTAQKQLAAQDYVFCVVTLKNLDSGLYRQVVHFHYTVWPTKGVPESAARLIKFVTDLRPYMEVSQGPAVMHCSTGTGRTGTLIAVDIGMHAYDDSRTIDVMNLVYRIRKERAGAVQTKEQYAFVYKALLEYAAECANSSCSGSASLSSERGSRLSLHECQNEL